MRERQAVFVDSGAWIALALLRDPYHIQACELWELLLSKGARLFTSIPVVLETFTFLERNTRRDVALVWKDSLSTVGSLRILECGLDDLEHSWQYFERQDLHKLSAVDTTSFTLMRRNKIRLVFSFDHHFAVVGYRLVN